eukprot:GHVU01181567.1.p1 GENE.GHVU01181567.1~~GHVU01181567.1.p1  ORF type:complete len:265 (+),score=34.46 GHVU01181567.1:443-1237(+)
MWSPSPHPGWRPLLDMYQNVTTRLREAMRTLTQPKSKAAVPDHSSTHHDHHGVSGGKTPSPATREGVEKKSLLPALLLMRDFVAAFEPLFRVARCSPATPRLQLHAQLNETHCVEVVAVATLATLIPHASGGAFHPGCCARTRPVDAVDAGLDSSATAATATQRREDNDGKGRRRPQDEAAKHGGGADHDHDSLRAAEAQKRGLVASAILVPVAPTESKGEAAPTPVPLWSVGGCAAASGSPASAVAAGLREAASQEWVVTAEA